MYYLKPRKKRHAESDTNLSTKTNKSDFDRQIKFNTYLYLLYSMPFFQELQKIIKIFFDYIRNSNEKIKSVVIPPLGHGFWAFPDDVIAKNMISTIVELGKDSQIHHLSVKVVCHKRENSVFKVRK